MMRKPYLIISIFFLVSLFNNINAQKKYATTNGNIYIRGTINETPFIARSNNLAIFLNYETTEFTLRLEKSSLHTGIDSLDEIFRDLKNDFIVYKGELGLDYIETNRHKPLNFGVKGYVDQPGDDIYITGEGQLVHVFGDIYSCVLSMNFNLDLNDLDFENKIEGLDNHVQIKIVQTVLDRDK